MNNKTQIGDKPEPAGPFALLKAAVSAMLPLALVVAALAALMPAMAAS